MCVFEAGIDVKPELNLIGLLAAIKGASDLVATPSISSPRHLHDGFIYFQH
jgi:hypothetical protein